MNDKKRNERKVENRISMSIRNLSEAIYEGIIDDKDLDFAEETIISLTGDLIILKSYREHLKKLGDEPDLGLDYFLISLMESMINYGCLIGTTKGRQSLITAAARKKRAEQRDLHLEAIRYALSQPPSYPFQKNRRGTSAIAKRALKAANQWLRDNGQPNNLTASAIQKRLEREQGNFPPVDTWLE